MGALRDYEKHRVSLTEIRELTENLMNKKDEDVVLGKDGCGHKRNRLMDAESDHQFL